MRYLLYIFIAALAFTACGGKGTPEEEAGKAAKKYYDYLLAGKYDKYLDGVCGIDSVSASYREQLLTNAKQYLYRQQDRYGGIRDVRVSHAEIDSARGYARAYLVLGYGDSINERVVVAMVERNGEWKMK